MNIRIACALAVSLAACSGNVQVSQQGSASGASAASSAGAGGAAGSSASSGAAASSVSASSVAASSVAASSSASSGAAGGSGGATGCKAQGPSCAPDEWCDFSNDLCGSSDWSGVCTKRPPSCTVQPPAPVCGCDGNSYVSACEAQQVGVDVHANATCSGPVLFACGPYLACKAGQEYCDVNGEFLNYQCLPLPASCLPPNVADCSCVPSPMGCGSCGGPNGQIVAVYGCG